MNNNQMYKTYHIEIKRSDGESIHAGHEQQFGIINLFGFESTEYGVNTITNAQVTGSQIVGRTIKERYLTLTLCYLNVDDAEFVNEFLIHFFSPRMDYEIIVNNCGVRRKIECVLSTGFNPHERSLWDPLTFDIGFLAPTALFTDVEPFDKDMSDHLPLFYCSGNHGFAIPSEGRTLSVRKFKEVTPIKNDGDDDTGIMLEFYVSRGNPDEAQTVNPWIAKLVSMEDHTIEEILRIKTTLYWHDRLYINTNIGYNQIQLLRNGEVERINVSNLKDRESTFFKMECGMNYLQYGAEQGRENLSLFPRWSRKWWGV